MEGSTAERNQTSPGQAHLTYPLRMAGEQAGGRADWEIKQEDFQRETRWLCSTPAAIVRRDGILTEAVWCVLVLSPSAKCWKTSTCWKTAKKIMESERLLIILFINFFFFFYNGPVGVHLGGMTCICLQETMKNDKDCIIFTAGAEVHCTCSLKSWETL